MERLHFVDLATGKVFGRVVDDIALFGRRWTIHDGTDSKVAKIQDKGPLRKLFYEFGVETTLPMPIVIEIVGPTGSSFGTGRRRLGTPKTIEVELEYGSGLDERLALEAALILDQKDARTRKLRALTWED